MKLCELMHCGFDPIHGFVIDAMHNIFLGVAKTLARLWFKKKYRNEPFSIRKRMKLVDEILASISKQVPHEFSRAPRGFIKNFAHYKGMQVQHLSNYVNLAFISFNFLHVILRKYLMLSFMVSQLSPCILRYLMLSYMTSVPFYIYLLLSRNISYDICFASDISPCISRYRMLSHSISYYNINSLNLSKKLITIHLFSCLQCSKRMAKLAAISCCTSITRNFARGTDEKLSKIE